MRSLLAMLIAAAALSGCIGESEANPADDVGTGAESIAENNQRGVVWEGAVEISAGDGVSGGFDFEVEATTGHLVVKILREFAAEHQIGELQIWAVSPSGVRSDVLTGTYAMTGGQGVASGTCCGGQRVPAQAGTWQIQFEGTGQHNVPLQAHIV